MRIDNPKDLGNVVRDRRNELGLTQARLGQEMGSTRFWIADLEAGKPGLGIGQVLRTLRALGMSIDVRPIGLTPAHTAGSGDGGAALTCIDLDALVGNDEEDG